MWNDIYQAGAFRERGQFMEPVEIDDGYGNVRRGFQLAGERWIDLHEQSAREISEAGAPRDTSQATMRVRVDQFTRRITSLWSVRVRGIDWSIKGIKEIGQRGIMFEMVVERGVAR